MYHPRNDSIALPLANRQTDTCCLHIHSMEYCAFTRCAFRYSGGLMRPRQKRLVTRMFRVWVVMYWNGSIEARGTTAKRRMSAGWMCVWGRRKRYEMKENTPCTPVRFSAGRSRSNNKLSSCQSPQIPTNPGLGRWQGFSSFPGHTRKNNALPNKEPFFLFFSSPPSCSSCSFILHPQHPRQPRPQEIGKKRCFFRHKSASG